MRTIGVDTPVRLDALIGYTETLLAASIAGMPSAYLTVRSSFRIAPSPEFLTAYRRLPT